MGERLTGPGWPWLVLAGLLFALIVVLALSRRRRSRATHRASAVVSAAAQAVAPAVLPEESARELPAGPAHPADVEEPAPKPSAETVPSLPVTGGRHLDLPAPAAEPDQDTPPRRHVEAVVEPGPGPEGPESEAVPESEGAPDGFAVKGNAATMLFHTVESPFYARTRADVWFNSEEAAVAAGYLRWDRG